MCDINTNTLFEYRGWVLNQIIKDVPIGGFLSAQLMCIWALVQEITCIESPSPVFEEIEKHWDVFDTPIALTPGPTLTFPTIVRFPKMSVCSIERVCVDGLAKTGGLLARSMSEGRLGHVIQSSP